MNDIGSSCISQAGPSKFKISMYQIILKTPKPLGFYKKTQNISKEWNRIPFCFADLCCKILSVCMIVFSWSLAIWDLGTHLWYYFVQIRK